MHEATAPAPAARGSLRLLGDPVYGPFFAGKLLATAGVWVHNIAAVVVVFELTGSATMVGAVSVAQFAPQLALTMWSGALADRGNRRRQLIAGRLISAVGSGGLMAWMVAVQPSGMSGAAAVIGTALLVGIGFAIGGPAMQAMLPSLVRSNELANAVALSSAPFTIARSAGPALGAALVGVGGPVLAFGVAAASQLAFVVVLVVLRIREVAGSRAKDSSIRAGLRHLRSDPTIALLLLGAATVGIGTDPVLTLAPSIADDLGAGREFVGALSSSFGIGAASAFLVLGWCRRRLGLARLGSGGLLLLAAGLGTLAVSSHPVPALLSVGVAGVGMTLSLTGFTTLLQQRAPEHLRGRVMALWSIAFLGSRPLAAAGNGLVADMASTTVALACVTALMVAGAWLARPSRVDTGASEGPDPHHGAVARLPDPE